MRAVLALVAGALVLFVVPSLVNAGGPDQQQPTTTSPTTTVVVDDENDTVVVGIGNDDTPVRGEDGSSGPSGSSKSGSSKPSPYDGTDCQGDWQRTITGDVITWIDDTTGNIMATWVESCPGIYTPSERVYRAPTPDDLIPGVYGEVIAQISPPVSDVNPPDRAPVNLGLWLATAGPEVISETEPVGPFTVTVTATLRYTWFDMGNDDVIRCDGLGEPISDLDTLEPGPCGYTYADLIEEGAHLGMRAQWDIEYFTSIGDGTLPPIYTESATPYTVFEIQTVGTD